METLTMYTTAWCPDCRRAKTFLKSEEWNFAKSISKKTHARKKSCSKPTMAGGKFQQWKSAGDILRVAPSTRKNSPRISISR